LILPEFLKEPYPSIWLTELKRAVKKWLMEPKKALSFGKWNNNLPSKLVRGRKNVSKMVTNQNESQFLFQ
jgi:hypothetical protein